MKQIIKGKKIPLDIEAIFHNTTLSEIIHELQILVDDYGDQQHLVLREYYGYDIYLQLFREETDSEETKRILKETKEKKRQEYQQKKKTEKDLQLFAKLKKQYEK